jgi:hypothetical protein
MSSKEGPRVWGIRTSAYEACRRRDEVQTMQCLTEAAE